MKRVWFILIFITFFGTNTYPLPNGWKMVVLKGYRRVINAEPPYFTVWKGNFFIPFYDETTMFKFENYALGYFGTIDENDSIRLSLLTINDFLNNYISQDSTFILGKTSDSTVYCLQIRYPNFSHKGKLWFTGATEVLRKVYNQWWQSDLPYDNGFILYDSNKFYVHPPMAYTKELDTIIYFKGKVFAFDSKDLPFAFGRFLAYCNETGEGYRFFIFDTVGPGVLDPYWGGAVDKYDRVTHIYTPTEIKTISKSRFIRKVKVTDLFPDFGRLYSVRYDQKLNALYLFGGGIIYIDDSMWIFKKLPEGVDVGTVPIDSSGNFWFTFNKTHLVKYNFFSGISYYELPEEVKNSTAYYIECGADGKIYILVFRDIALILVFDPSVATAVEDDNRNNKEISNFFVNNIYPNPTLGNVSVAFSLDLEFLMDFQIELYNLLGEKLFTLTQDIQQIEYDRTARVAKIELDLKGLARGIYYINFIAGKTMQTQVVLLE